ncbi:N-acetylglucosaminyldiphosphoundecaprenol N-acetyl-beta-D-mannosaminyltransferase [Sinosporangium album]|uniref:N-acetylglucosaminyldiphosphoundecaprenol N-acetyl-beta-D-mannosaminyltransferase n=1 Tax=Sinosporangium album TaxID=504805 RepID=A0A1G8AID9_9ACTN|nr:WecB/TagA/CpsF family glycosyltransferase [Sinosporangium album]SDH20718.1 N-acetylglucosaminyldiphosphoundecaprenol N-acetyl-beta-D-mannosaminyltransferase [Sinosporangium album]
MSPSASGAAPAADVPPAAVPPRPGPGRVEVAGVWVDALTEGEVVERVAAAARAGRGGHIVTPNVDICRAAARDAAVRALVARADIAVADGMPLVWASRLLGSALPERVTGADLIWSLSAMAAAEALPVYLLGGPPGVVEHAAEVLSARSPGLVVAGVSAPPYGFESSAEGVAEVREALVAAAPRLVFVGLGFPKQDRLIAELRECMPGVWFVGCGAAIAFTAGAVRRAPEWMRDAGLEWLFRLISEPGRLARRYLVDDLPFALRLLAMCLLSRVRRRVVRGRRGELARGRG